MHAHNLCMASSSQIQKIHDAYIENADFEEACSVEKARAFITAARRLMVFAQSSANQSSSMSFDYGAIRAERQRAEAFLAANNASGSGARTNGGANPGELNCFGFNGYER